MHASFAKSSQRAIPLHAVAAKDVKGFLAKYPYLKASGFTAKEGELRLLPGKVGLSGAVLGLGAVATKDLDPWMVYAGVPALPVKQRAEREQRSPARG